MASKITEEDDAFVQIGYTDRQTVKQKLLMLAAKQGHGSVVQVIRNAVDEYLKRHRRQVKLAKAG